MAFCIGGSLKPSILLILLPPVLPFLSASWPAWRDTCPAGSLAADLPLHSRQTAAALVGGRVAGWLLSVGTQAAITLLTLFARDPGQKKRQSLAGI